MNTSALSRLVGWTQTALFCAFGAAVLLDRSAPLMAPSRGLAAGGTVLALAGVALVLVAIQTLGRSIQIEPEPKATGELTTRGIYRWLRHPIYTGILGVIFGVFLRQPTTLVAAAGAVTVAFLLIKVRFEERLLGRHYAGYAAYRRRSWGVIPPFRF
ncbi:MAG TPA: isoprenylcysteine carboxylmethyltransferase family protein [Vicinamibacterales bacterium]|nr:isoprenylcysteine carboxylmethyltransferase family protein [Vicinamibacterales bacterium]